MTPINILKHAIPTLHIILETFGKLCHPKISNQVIQLGPMHSLKILLKEKKTIVIKLNNASFAALKF